MRKGLVKAKRVLNGETSAQGKTRLLVQRQRLVGRTLREKLVASFDTALQITFNKNLKGLRFWLHPCSTPLYASFALKGSGSGFGFCEYDSRICNGKRELLIETVQGYPFCKDEIAKFERLNMRFGGSDNKKTPWNVIFVQSFIDAAYRAGFDRVLLRDVTTTKSYKKPVMLMHSPLSEGEIKSAMKQLYTRTRKVCGFTKEEWVGEGRYFVREFS